MGKGCFLCWQPARENPSWTQRSSWGKHWVAHTHTHEVHALFSPHDLLVWLVLLTVSRQSPVPEFYVLCIDPHCCPHTVWGGHIVSLSSQGLTSTVTPGKVPLLSSTQTGRPPGSHGLPNIWSLCQLRVPAEINEKESMKGEVRAKRK